MHGTKENNARFRNAIILILLIIVADQALKIFIKTNFCVGDEVKIAGGWFRLHFIENEGMAYGMKLSDSVVGKILLSSFRLIAVIFGFYLLRKIIDKGYSKGAVICGALILAGAMGNLLDSMFYGLMFTESPYSCFSSNYDSMQYLLQNHHKEAVARMTSLGHGYGSFLQGRVVDMLYFPIVDTRLPVWVPFWGGRNFIFFEPVFNIADASISVGVLVLVFFQKRLIHSKPVQNIITQEA